MSLKLYVLIDSELAPGQQAVQAGHALAQFAVEYPGSFQRWQNDSNILVYLSVDNIFRWDQLLTDGEFHHSTFVEPDELRFRVIGNVWTRRSNMLTAIAVEPNWVCQYILFKDLTLALRGEDVTTRKRWWRL